MIKALVFDFDGLILDTETPEYYALNEIYNEHGHELPITTFGRVVGSQYNHEYEPVRHLRELTGKHLDAEALMGKLNARRTELIEKNTILPGVENLIRAAKTRGLKLAVASSSAHEWVDTHLKRLKLYSFFDVVKCKDDVINIKPEPDLFLAAIKALQVGADEAVIFEDSLNGIIAAKRAGIRVVAVPNMVTKHLDIKGETLRLHSLADMTLDELLSNL
jgi:putative hydrolase of the HAD superfamily